MSTAPPPAPDEDETGFARTAPEAPPPIDDADGGGDEARPLQLMPTIGHVGRYALKYRLGEGGLGTVHAALDPLLSRAIAVKTLRLQVHAAQRETLEPLLLHEARAAASLNHPHIVTVYDAGLAPEGVYIAMERLQGRDLRHLLADGWRPAPTQAAQIVRRVADALAYAHSKGVVHCDIKPANIFMVGRTQPKVLDFGIARITHAHAQTEEAPADAALIAGSPLYMAPEQLRGEALDARCDVYALGVVLYELLTGRRPFGGHSLDEIRQAVLRGAAMPVRQLAPTVPAALAEIAERAMALAPEARFRSARQLSRALRQALGEPGADEPMASLWAGRVPLLASVAAALLFGAWGSLQMLRGPPDAAAPAAAQAAVPAPPAAPVERPAPAVVQAVAEPPKPAPVAATTPRRPAREPRVRDSAGAAPPAVAAPATGIVQIAVSPWGSVEVDGTPAGTTPPLNRLQLSAGRHTIVIRNEDFPPFTTTVTVSAERPVTVRHRFGS